LVVQYVTTLTLLAALFLFCASLMPHTFFFLMSFLVAAQAYIWNYVFALSL